MVIADVVEHIEDCYSFLRKIKSKSNYKVLIIPIEMFALSIIFNSILGSRSSVGHIHYFTKETALETLNDCGYDIIDYSYIYDDKNERLRRILSSRILHIPRKIALKIGNETIIRILGGPSLIVLAK